MIDELSIIGFKVSNNWCIRFLRRNNFVFRQKIKIVQKLFGDFEEKIVDFYRFVLNCRKKGNYEFANIGNMDEISVWFDMLLVKIVNIRGEKTVIVVIIGYEKFRFIVVFFCLVDSIKLKSMKIQSKEKFFLGVVVYYYFKGWMDADGIKLWIQKVWRFRFGGMVGIRSLFVWDSF